MTTAPTEHLITLIPHAAHTGNGSGWDLEQIVVQSDTRPEVIERDLPAGFTYHSGFVRDGQQNWVFYRHAPLSAGRCPRCI